MYSQCNGPRKGTSHKCTARITMVGASLRRLTPGNCATSRWFVDSKHMKTYMNTVVTNWISGASKKPVCWNVMKLLFPQLKKELCQCWCKEAKFSSRRHWCSSNARASLPRRAKEEWKWWTHFSMLMIDSNQKQRESRCLCFFFLLLTTEAFILNTTRILKKPCSICQWRCNNFIGCLGCSRIAQNNQDQWKMWEIACNNGGHSWVIQYFYLTTPLFLAEVLWGIGVDDLPAYPICNS